MSSKSQRKGADGERELAAILRERLNVGEAMDQAIRDSERMVDGVPTLFHRRNRKPWLVTMRLVDWLELFEAHKTLTKHVQPPGK